MKTMVASWKGVCGLVLTLGLLAGAAGAQGYGPPQGPPPDGRWQRGPEGPPPQGNDTLRVNQSLGRGQSLYSRSGEFQLEFQNDGNVVLKRTRSGRVLWATGTAGSRADRLTMQEDGNAVLYTQRGRPLWSSGVTGPDMRHGQVLVVQDDGNLVVYSRGRVYWASGTQR
jgi:hypothetical protein